MNVAEHPAPERLGMLIVAPFERGREHGGSQRATALAERMEDRGVEVHWRRIGASHTSKRQKAADMLRLQPMYLRFYPPPASPRPAVESAAHIALAAHSFLAPQLDATPSSVVRVVDFHNLEWQHLADSARLERRGSTFVDAARALHLRVQVRLLRRFERTVVRRTDLCLFVSEAERAWARRIAPTGNLILVPSILPRSTEQAALSIADRREAHSAPRTQQLVYVGTLTFPPNVMSLKAFLASTWPQIRRACPEAELLVAGEAPTPLRAEIDGIPGARALGYVANLASITERCAGALMPIDGHAGTSLRVLYYALARIPVIGTPAAFRGFGSQVGVRAGSPAEWTQAVRVLLGHGAACDGRARLIDDAQRAVLQMQRDPTPWDHLHGELARLVRLRRRGEREQKHLHRAHR